MQSSPFWGLEAGSSNSVVFVLGTDTNVGKTCFVEALIRTAPEPDRLFVVKAVQTGTDGGDRDLLRYLEAGATSSQVWEGYSFSRPLDPMTAASLESQVVEIDFLVKKISEIHGEGTVTSRADRR